MDELIKKYHLGTLSPAELKQLKEMAGAISDEELTKLLIEHPVRPMPSVESISDFSVSRIKNNIDAATRPDRLRTYFRIAVAAAVIAILAMTASWLYIGHAATQPAHSHMAVTTGRGRNTEVSLPDGSIAVLGNCTDLKMTLDDGTRAVSFNGDAYFKVAHAPEGMPQRFEIMTTCMKVEVLGTEFSISSRSGAESASLILDAGSVLLTANSSGATVRLTPGHMATLDVGSGTFHVDDASIAGYDSPWLRHEIVLKDADADAISSALYNTYGVRLPESMLKAIDSPFTGTLPADDLISALTIIERLYIISE